MMDDFKDLKCLLILLKNLLKLIIYDYKLSSV